MEMEKRVGYKDLVSLCEEFGLNPQKEGDNKSEKNGPFIINRPVVLETIFFTGDNQKEAFETGNRLWNLFSQTKNYSSYNYASKTGREEAQRDSLIKEILSIFEQLILFYFCTEAKIDGYIVYHGIIYRINLDEDAVMTMAKQQIEDLKKRFKSSSSEE